MTTGQVLYRKWRPQTLGKVVGQGPITQTLLSALRLGRVGHAYLFCGPRGTGKTSTARILAKAVNCETNEGRDEPCNVCPACREITDGSFLDLVEVDAASNRGIDEVRDLREKVRFMPAHGRFKVYIIDEVHMMTDAAFNALLKTLEEPPGHAIFVLATTEPHKVPLTIASRCQRFDFRRIPADAAATRLEEIAAAEGFHVEREALEVVVRAANGSLRDASNFLEQLVLTAGSEATAQDARDLFSVAGSARARQLIATLLVQNDLAAALLGLTRLQEEGVDMRQVHRELVEELRTLLLLRAGAGEVLDLMPDDLTERRDTAGRLELGVIRNALSALAPLSLAPGSPPLPLEMAFVGISLRGAEAPQAAPPVAPEPSPPVSQERRGASAATTPLARPASAASRRRATPEPAPPPTPPPAAANKRPAPEKATSPDGAPAEPDRERGPGDATPVPTETGGTVAAGVLTLDELRSRWRKIVDGLRGTGSRGDLDAVLRSVSVPIAVEDGAIVIGFYHDFHKQKIEDPKYRRLVERRFAEILGKPYEIRCEKIERAQPRGHLVRAAVSRGARVVEQRREPPKAEDVGG